MPYDASFSIDNHPDDFDVNATCPLCGDEMEYSSLWEMFHCPNCGYEMREDEWDGGFDEEAEWY